MTQTGTVKKVELNRGFGFIEVVGQSDIFFHRSGLADGLDFDERLIERRVEFDVVPDLKGHKAIKIRPAE